METARWIVAAVAGVLSFCIIAGNPIAGLLASRQGRNYSFVRSSALFAAYSRA
ncbi:MAG: hypothetical protein AB7O52_15805 [Planctomycetota bacterium]